MTLYTTTTKDTYTPSCWFDSTRGFYEKMALEYSNSTREAQDISGLDDFISRLRPGDNVLDLGCGSGRDLKRYRQRGFLSIGLDYSYPLCVLASKYSGAPVVVGDILHLPFADGGFRGASAIASLLHIPRSKMPNALAEIHRVLEPNGVLLTTVKRGSGEHQDSLGRWFSYFEPEEWAAHLQSAGFLGLELRVDHELRNTDHSTQNIDWISCICTRNNGRGG